MDLETVQVTNHLAPRVGIKPLSSYLSLNDCFEQKHNKNDTYSY